MKADGSDVKKEAGAAAPTEGKEGSQAKSPAPTDTIGAWVEKHKGQLEKALPRQFSAERFSRVFLTAIRMNPKLKQADFYSLLGAMMESAQLGLEPNTPLGHCYIIPYNDNRTKKINAQFQMGYKGLIDLAHRSRQYRKLVARAVDEADRFEYAYGLDEYLSHKPSDKPTGNKVYYYAQYELDNGGRSFIVWSKDQVLQHAKRYSKSFDNKDSAWQTAFDQMACKTVLIDLLRYAPKSVEVSRAASLDNRALSVNPDDPDLTVETIDGDFELSG